MKVIAEFDETDYGLLCKPDEVALVMASLNALYGVIWTEACYDADTESTQKMCRRLLPHIQKLNEILRFKR